MIIKCVWEHNGDDSLLYAANFVGAFTRGSSLDIAIRKMPCEIQAYLKWKGESVPNALEVEIIQQCSSELSISDADSDVIFDEERKALSVSEYFELKSLVLKSAQDFMTLYSAIPDKDESCLPARSTFYGSRPRTASEMYEHTKNVNAYYWGEIGVSADNIGSILECRKRGFTLLENQPHFLDSDVCSGSYGEEWSLRKVLRRFIWHDRIHAKAMYRMAVNTFNTDVIPNVFFFDV